jgi:hypothetical protein
VEYRAAKEVLSLVFSILLFPPSFISLSSGMRRTMGRWWLDMQGDVRVRKGHQLFSGAHSVTDEAARQQAFA